MQVSTERKMLNLNKSCINKVETKWIEQDIIVPDTKPDALKIIHVNVTPYVCEVEISNGKIKVVGKLNYFIIYRVDDEIFNTRGLFSSYPFNDIMDIKEVNKEMDISVIPKIKNVIFTLPNERKISIKSEIAFDIMARQRVNLNIINSFSPNENIESKIKTDTFSNILQNKNAIISSKDDVILPKEAQDFFEILNLSTKIINTDYKESYNKIMVKGDIEVVILYLSNNEQQRIKKTKVLVPFSAMIELENISDKSKFSINYNIQNFEIKENSDITTTKTMSADYRIQADVVMYEDDEIEYVDDFYSQTRELNYENSRIDVVKKQFNVNKNIEIRENLVNILQENENIIDYNFDVNSIIPSTSDNMVHIEGNVKVNMIVQNKESGNVDNKQVEVLVNADTEIENATSEAKIIVNISNNGMNLSQSGKDVDIDMNIAIKAYIENVAPINIINDVEAKKLDLSNLDSMNIYIVKPGDTLWNIAKKYKTSVDKILKTNEDILDEDKINAGQKIFIIR